MTIEKFEDLVIWQQGRELAKEIYELTKADCWREGFEFRNQIRNSSGSVPDNIAEGFEREGNNEFIQFLSISKGSCGECRSQIYRAFDRTYIDKVKLDYFVEKTSRICSKIHNTIISVRKSDFRGRKYKTDQPENAPKTNQTPQTHQTHQTK
jgi:four helix bundle protein